MLRAMCGRFALTLPQTALIDLFEAAPWPPAVEDLAVLDRPRHNIRPTERVPVAALDENGARVLRPMRWGFLPHWAKGLSDGPPLINARSETIAEKPAFAKSARERRCLIPADGFYEWRASAGRGQEPHWIYAASGAPLVFAGVWRVWRGADKTGAPFEIASCAIVTTAANAALEPLHERLPVVVPPEQFGLWLGEEGRGAARLMTAPDDAFYAHHPVSRLINKGGRAAPDSPDLRAETAPGAPAPSDGDAPSLL